MKTTVEPKGPFCQSCSMPMGEATDAEWGTNADGSKNNEYCSYCYQEGAFTDDGTVEQMIETAAKGWSEQDPDVSYEEALSVCKESIPHLKRWQ